MKRPSNILRTLAIFVFLATFFSSCLPPRHRPRRPRRPFTQIQIPQQQENNIRPFVSAGYFG
ncbi:hypothetical protein [Niabella soli]|uniref:hypothetical protein n=1 Tax=Niabella soli TaxID=446683 RepID=UPI0002499DB1|nr:hypothetical protein [Niabella soli]